MSNITEITKRSGRTYRVEYTDSFGEQSNFEVSASDELEAFATAKKLLEKKSMTARILMLCMTATVLALFGLIGFGCSQENRFMDSCLKAGKSYVSENNGHSCK